MRTIGIGITRNTIGKETNNSNEILNTTKGSKGLKKESQAKLESTEKKKTSTPKSALKINFIIIFDFLIPKFSLRECGVIGLIFAVQNFNLKKDKCDYADLTIYRIKETLHFGHQSTTEIINILKDLNIISEVKNTSGSVVGFRLTDYDNLASNRNYTKLDIMLLDYYKELTFTEQVLLARIDRYCLKSKSKLTSYCYATPQRLAKDLDMDYSFILKTIKKLFKEKFLICSEEGEFTQNLALNFQLEKGYKILIGFERKTALEADLPPSSSH